jgi:hypothetical protein
MKAIELRLGNWVEQPNDGVTRVTAVLNDLQIKTETGYVDKYCRPIPLTEEWLLKFGFEKIEFNSEKHGYGTEYHLEKKDVFFVYCDDFSLGIYGSVRDYEGNSLAIIPPHENINHVHQFQNLYFALTGKELELT